MYHNYFISKIVTESATIKSFYLKRKDNETVEKYLPGQFIKVRVKPDISEKELTRNYTISDSPGKDYLRLTIKREENGIVSKHFHDVLKIGDIVEISNPAGNFYLNIRNPNKVVLLSGGVGITPMLSMLEYLAVNEPTKKVFFLHSSLNKAVQPMFSRLKELTAIHSNLNLSIHHSNPTADEKHKIDYDYEGIISKEYLESLLPKTEIDVFLCGPTPFMEAMYKHLTELGIKEKRINYEFFGEGKKLGCKPSTIEPVTNIYKVKFSKSGIETYWKDSNLSILELAEEKGLKPDFSCRMGTCSTCESILVSGDIEYEPEPFMEAEEGKIFICCSKPISDLILDL